jgi:hypothetical protein
MGHPLLASPVAAHPTIARKIREDNYFVMFLQRPVRIASQEVTCRGKPVRAVLILGQGPPR